MGEFRLGYHHETGGIFVQPMNNSGSDRSADSPKIRAMKEQSIDQGSAAVSGCGMDDESRLLVDHKDVPVLVQDMKRDRFGLKVHHFGFRNMALDPVTGLQAIARFFGLLINKNSFIDDQCGRQRTGTLRHVGGNNCIKPSAGIRFLDYNGKGTIHG